MSRITTALNSVLAGIAVTFTTASTAFAGNYPVGVLGLYNASSPQSINIDKAKLAALDCIVRRTGIIAAAQGNIDLEKPNQFVLLACAQALPSLSKLDDLSRSSRAIAILEGDLTDYPEQKRKHAISQREYVLKIGHYNNIDITARDRDLATINREASLLKDRYTTESFIGVNQASGLPTPDEVIVMYYDDAATGHRFRKNNGQLMKKITAFNQSHLVDAVYYIGSAHQ